MKTREKKPPAQERRCQREAGTEKQCRAARMFGSKFCFFHDPVIRGHRLELLELEHVPLGRSREVHQLLARSVEAVEQKRLNPQQAYAIGWLAQLLLKSLEGVEKERSYHHSESFGQLVADAWRRWKSGEKPAPEDEYGPEEAEPSEWVPME